jgi:NAD-dependent protein deacetylase/lipoamidase
MKIVVLTGAGISAESGIQTFRDADGLWEGHDVMDVATPEAFERNPALVYRFYNDRRRALSDVEPNAAHRELIRLEDAFGMDFLLITQNVDDLHDRQGHERMLHMHGQLYQARTESGRVLEWRGDMDSVSRDPETGESVRPHIVWFGETPLYMDEIDHAVRNCDIFCAIGTSGVVYPAAGLSDLAWRNSAKTVEINPRPTGGPFSQVIEGSAAEAVPRWVDDILRRTR